MEVFKACILESNQAALYAEPDAFGPCTILEIGEYLTAESLGIEGGAIRAIEVGTRVEAQACSDENMKGECVDLKESMSRIGLSTIKSLRVRFR